MALSAPGPALERIGAEVVPHTDPTGCIGTIGIELVRRGRLDQEVRQGLIDIDRLRETDTDNAAWLRQVIAGHGWPDAVRFGARAAYAAWLLVQHSADVELMETVLPAIRDEVERGVLEPFCWLSLADRVALGRGRPQRFGTQASLDDQGVWRVLPLEDEAEADRERARFGMSTVAGNLARLQAIYRLRSGVGLRQTGG